MSRTDKTQPFRVKLFDGTLVRVAAHDHRDGHCDLAPETGYHDASGIIVTGRCRWEFLFTGVGVCCCGLCRDRCGYRVRLRSDRRIRRISIGENAKAWRAGSRDVFDQV